MFRNATARRRWNLDAVNPCRDVDNYAFAFARQLNAVLAAGVGRVPNLIVHLRGDAGCRQFTIDHLRVADDR
jgi:hypothetical protein